MSRRLPMGKFYVVGLVVGALSLALLAGCAGGPSQEELSLLEEKRQAMEAAQAQVEEKQAEVARLERELAEKKAAKKALEEKRTAVKANLAE